MSPTDRVAQFYSQVQCSLFIAFYDSQGYGGGILTFLHTGEYYELYDQVKEDEMGRTCSTNGILVGKPEGKIPLGRPRRKWVYNIKLDLGDIGWDGMDWIDLAQDRDRWRALVNTLMNLRLP
jgi:hypothetical protein